VLLGETKVYDENFFEVLAKNEVGSLDISVNEATVVHFFNGFKHLNE